jgi:hypothetical protein
MVCKICMETDVPVDQMVSMPCSHSYCKECWADFFTQTVKIMDATASRCLRMRCPQAQCNEHVTEEEIRKSAPELLPHYQAQQFSSFLTGMGNGYYAHSCPGTECNYIAVSSRDHRFGNRYGHLLPVSCGGCFTEFCFRCGEPHQELQCRIIDKQPKEEGDHKNCPKCKVCIEKNGGCNHMMCRCGHEFCWLCLEDTRGIHSCGRERPQRGVLRERDDVAEMLDDRQRDRLRIRDLPSCELEYVCDTLARYYGSELQEDASLVIKKKKDMTRLAHYYARYEAHHQGQWYAASRTTDVALQRDAFFQLPDIFFGNGW